MSPLSLSLLLYLAFVLAPLAASQSLIQIPSQKPRADDDLFCDSWRLSVETNNAGSWNTVPLKCAGFVADYINGERYSWDSKVVAAEALDFARTVPIAGDGKDVWVFDIDETLLSNAPYYSAHGFGSEGYNATSFDEWVNQAKAPALPESLKLYNELQGLGFQVVLLTGRDEHQRAVTEEDLSFAGYHSWERLFLRGDADQGTSAVAYKSGKRAELLKHGYRIHGSSGDQWSDLIGSPIATRSFKLPNPMYYIG